MDACADRGAAADVAPAAEFTGSSSIDVLPIPAVALLRPVPLSFYGDLHGFGPRWRVTSHRVVWAWPATLVSASAVIGPTVLKTIIPNTPAQIWITAQAIRALPHILAPRRRRLTSFGGNAAAMLNAAHLRRPQDLTPHP